MLDEIKVTILLAQAFYAAGLLNINCFKKLLNYKAISLQGPQRNPELVFYRRNIRVLNSTLFKKPSVMQVRIMRATVLLMTNFSDRSKFDEFSVTNIDRAYVTRCGFLAVYIPISVRRVCFFRFPTTLTGGLLYPLQKQRKQGGGGIKF
jgi:hypothetical protein